MTVDRPRGSLALRLAAAFVTVAIAAVVVLAGLIVVATDTQTRQLLDREHRNATTSAAAAAARAYADAGGWTAADLDTTAAIAASAEARLVVTASDGTVAAAPTDQLAEMMAAMHGVATVDQPRGRPVTADVIVDGDVVGTVSLTFPTAHGGPADQLRTALWRTAVIGTLLATVVALVVAVFVARRLTRPVTVLTDAASRLAAGDAAARAEVSAPGELGVLAHTFDDMADRLETTARVRRQMVADIAHELRTPLAILHGETEALLDGVTQPDEAALASLHDEIARLIRLVGDLETLAAADAARLTMRHDRVDLADVAARAAAAVQKSAGDGHLLLHTDLSPGRVDGDSDRLHQVVLNLLSNALKFTPPGGSVTVTTRAQGGSAELMVDDTGPGVPVDDAPHLFDRFWQGELGVRTGGSGIGLAVASELTAAHGGTLTVGTNAAGGTRFTLRLPRSPQS